MVRAAGLQRKAGGRQTDLHRPHLSPPVGFGFNKDGTFLMFIGKHQNTRSMGLRIPAQRVQDVVWSSWSRFTWLLRWAICTPAWFTPGFHLCSSLHARRWTALQSQPSRVLHPQQKSTAKVSNGNFKDLWKIFASRMINNYMMNNWLCYLRSCFNSLVLSFVIVMHRKKVLWAVKRSARDTPHWCIVGKHY